MSLPTGDLVQPTPNESNSIELQPTPNDSKSIEIVSHPIAVD